MITTVRCHIKSNDRLALLTRTLVSAQTHGLDKDGEIIVIDDQSPMEVEVRELCSVHGVQYIRSSGQPGTVNGLVESIRRTFVDAPLLCCVDDIVFGRGIRDVLSDIQRTTIPSMDERGIKWGMIGLFACYENRPSYLDTGLWNIPIDILYALNCHVFSPALSRHIINVYDRIEHGELPRPVHQDDLWVKELCKETGMLALNTRKDYAQHTGMYLRSFGDNPREESSTYQSRMFVGE